MEKYGVPKHSNDEKISSSTYPFQPEMIQKTGDDSTPKSNTDSTMETGPASDIHDTTELWDTEQDSSSPTINPSSYLPKTKYHKKTIPYNSNSDTEAITEPPT
jgi:hypothetical protein